MNHLPVNSRLAKRPLVFNGRLANRGLTSLVKEATGDAMDRGISMHGIAIDHGCTKYWEVLVASALNPGDEIIC